jgi:hypothetical protein
VLSESSLYVIYWFLWFMKDKILEFEDLVLVLHQVNGVGELFLIG